MIPINLEINNLISSTVNKLFGPGESKFKISDTVVKNYYGQTADLAIKNFLDENSPLSLEIKKIIEQINDNPEKKNT